MTTRCFDRPESILPVVSQGFNYHMAFLSELGIEIQKKKEKEKRERERESALLSHSCNCQTRISAILSMQLPDTSLTDKIKC